MQVHIGIRIHAVYMCVHVCTCVHMYVHVCMCVCVCVCVCVFTSGAVHFRGIIPPRDWYVSLLLRALVIPKSPIYKNINFRVLTIHN